MKKNIGIMTFHRAHNYGALLQAYALQKLLEKEYNPFFLDYYDKKIYDQYKIFRPIGKNFIKWPKRIVKNLKKYGENKKRYNVFNGFIENSLVVKKYDKKIYNKCDILITGSDQVWNPEITGGLKKEYALNFGKQETRRISYAASCGTCENIKKYSDMFEKRLGVIDKISIREDSCKDDIENVISNKEATVVLDPTMLLDFNEWQNKIKDINVQCNEKYILAYVVAQNEEYIKIVDEISKKTGLKVLSMSKDNLFENQIDNEQIYNPLEFVKLICGAEYVITTSFHATVFSIIFGKKLWVIPHKQTGSRVVDLLSKLDISNRAVANLEEFSDRNYEEEIDYVKVNKRLKEERDKSINWLYNAIDE